jgi:hypothetical protein
MMNYWKSYGNIYYGITLIQLTLNFIGNMYKRINLPLFYAHIYHVACAKSVMV